MTWPRGDAPGGVWIDRCYVSPDGRYYLGRNQWQAAITGEAVLAETHFPRAFRRFPLECLDCMPSPSMLPEGELSIWADFGDVRDGWVPVYVVNRTKKPVKLPAQDGDIYLKLFAKSADGDWERAQIHIWSDCGNSYYFTPEIPPGHFVVTRGHYPKEGEERRVRYRLQGKLDAVSNEGPGRVSPKMIEASRMDPMALTDGDFTRLSEVALGEVKAPIRFPVNPRLLALELLAERHGDDPRTKRIIAQLTKDRDPAVAEMARSLTD
jgi:hypothetical protein